MTTLGDGVLGIGVPGSRREHGGSNGARRRAGLWVGPLILVVGAWGAGVAYFGPDLGLSPVGWQPWRWSTAHTVLNLAPGVAAMVAGAAVIASRWTPPALTRAAGLLAAACGAWFVLGTSAYPALMGSAAPAYGGTSRGALANLAAVAGYGRGVGLVLGVLAGLALVGTERPTRAVRSREDAVPGVSEDSVEAVDALEPVQSPSGTSERLAPVVPAPIAPVGEARNEPGWRPQFRSTISRMVPRSAGQDAPTSAEGAAGLIGGVPRSVGVIGETGGPETGWRPRFSAASVSGDPPTASGQPAGPGAPAPVVPRGVLRPGEWLVAAYRDARLAAGDRETSGQGTAVVTNCRVIFAHGDRQSVRDWSLEAVDLERDSRPEVIDLTDGAELDLPDSATGVSFAAAVQAANRGRQPVR